MHHLMADTYTLIFFPYFDLVEVSQHLCKLQYLFLQEGPYQYQCVYEDSSFIKPSMLILAVNSIFYLILPILGSSNSAANKDDDCKQIIWTNGDTIIWLSRKHREKEKLLVMSNFSSSDNVFKSCLLLTRQNEYPWSKRLNIAVWCLLKKRG